MYHEYFPREVLALQEEITHHPALMAQLLQLGPDVDVIDKLTEVTAFCGMVLDGVYTNEEVLRICELATEKLFKSREELIQDILLPTATSLLHY
jgi:hypothetical protein